MTFLAKPRIKWFELSMNSRDQVFELFMADGKTSVTVPLTTHQTELIQKAFIRPEETKS